MRDFNRNGKSDCHDRYLYHKGFETRMDALKKMDEPSLHIESDHEVPTWGSILKTWAIVVLGSMLLSVLGVQ